MPILTFSLFNPPYTEMGPGGPQVVLFLGSPLQGKTLTCLHTQTCSGPIF